MGKNEINHSAYNKRIDDSAMVQLLAKLDETNEVHKEKTAQGEINSIRSHMRRGMKVLHDYGLTKAEARQFLSIFLEQIYQEDYGYTKH